MSSKDSVEFKSCAFCIIEKKEKDLYKCPKCGNFYCSLRCYRSKKHFQCSENFYEKECREMEGEKLINQEAGNVSRPNLTFDEYMESKREEQRKLTEKDVNPQIKIRRNEEVLFDSDDEPEYLSTIVESTLKEYNDVNSRDVDKDLLTAGLPMHLDESDEMGQDQLEHLYQKLNDEEKRAFTRLADDMFSREMGFNASCFQKRNKK